VAPRGRGWPEMDIGAAVPHSPTLGVAFGPPLDPFQGGPKATSGHLGWPRATPWLLGVTFGQPLFFIFFFLNKNNNILRLCGENADVASTKIAKIDDKIT